MNETLERITSEEADVRQVICGTCPDNPVLCACNIYEECFNRQLYDQCRTLEGILFSDTTTENPVRYYTDGQPYVVIGGMEITDHPAVVKLAELDRLEKYILPNLQARLAAAESKAGSGA